MRYVEPGPIRQSMSSPAFRNPTGIAHRERVQDLTAPDGNDPGQRVRSVMTRTLRSEAGRPRETHARSFACATPPLCGTSTKSFSFLIPNRCVCIVRECYRPSHSIAQLEMY